MILSGPIAIAVTVLGLVKPDLKGYVALWGLTVLSFDSVVFTPWQKRLRESGARIQELFDCIVLGLLWNEIKAGKRPDPELIHERSQKYCNSGEPVKDLKNWYPVSVEAVPHEWGAVICQRANVFWDSKLRRRYATAVFILALLVTVMLVWVAFSKDTRFSDLIVFVAAPMASAYVIAYRQITEHREAADRLDKLRDHSGKLFAEAIGGASVTHIKTNSRLLQDEIFDGRKRNPPIFDFIFKMLRAQNELEMNKGAEALIKEAKAVANKATADQMLKAGK